MNKVLFNTSSESISNLGILLGILGGLKSEDEETRLGTFTSTLSLISEDPDVVQGIKDAELYIGHNNTRHELWVYYEAEDKDHVYVIYVNGQQLVGFRSSPLNNGS